MLTTTTKNYTKNHCWQYEIRQKNFLKDLKASKLTHKEISSLKVSDFDFFYISKTDKFMCEQIKQFILDHEWLGTMPQLPTHRFIATYKGKLAGVVIMSTPNAFSYLLGKENRNLEKLISRGACISWSPKNLASALIMYSIKWMVKNTEFRYFTGYSDTEAKELGTIYQACNFIYLGKNSGAKYKYFDPLFPDKGWFTDREFRRLRSYKKYANELGFEFKKHWHNKSKILWQNIPDHFETALKSKSAEHQRRCKRVRISRKHKYLYILGKNKKETKKLKTIFSDRNPKLVNLTYPKMRSL